MTPVAVIRAIMIKLTSTRFASSPCKLRKIRMNVKTTMVLQPMMFRVEAERVLSSSSGKTGAAKKL
jgi:hypothetical protein